MMIDAIAVVLKDTIITTNVIEMIIMIIIEDVTLMEEEIDVIVGEGEEIDGRVDQGKPVCLSNC
jgi:hypothetical protein